MSIYVIFNLTKQEFSCKLYLREFCLLKEEKNMKSAVVLVLTIIVIFSISQFVAVAVDNYSYNTDIEPLIAAKGCIDCHSWMGSYDSIMSQYIWSEGMRLVKSAEPDSSILIWRIAGEDNLGNTVSPRMPDGGPYYSEAEIQIFKDWISQGAPEDVPVGVEDTKSWLDVKKQFK